MRNVGNADRILRIAAAIVFVIIAVVVGPGSVAGIILFILAAVMAGTAAVGFCPLYAPLKMNTCKR